MPVFLIIGASVMVLGSMRENGKVKRTLQKHTNHLRYLPEAVSMLVLAVQFSELLKVIHQVSVANVAGSLLLLSIVVATKSGTEGNLH